MITPFKAIIGPNYKEIDTRLITAIHIRFGLPGTLPHKIEALIKRADRISAYLEATQLAGFTVTEARKIFGAPKIGTDLLIEPVTPDQAKSRYLKRYRLLGGA